MFYQIMKLALLSLQNVYEKTFYTAVKSYRTPWPPMIDQGSTELPELVNLFMTELLKTERHSPSRSDNIGSLIQSYSSYLVHGVSRGDTITAKHFLLAL